MQIGKIQKITHFLGPVDPSLPPLFLNSMPKAGTNLIEKFLVFAGYRREFARCLNEHNLGTRPIRQHPGRFNIGHLFDDAAIHAGEGKSIYVRRELWACIRSYVNYMCIDERHPASAFIRDGIRDGAIADNIERLIFTDKNPLGRSILSEYERFFSIDTSRYDLVVDFGAFAGVSSEIVDGFSILLSSKQTRTQSLMHAALEAKTWTKNVGAIDLFKEIEPDRRRKIQEGVEAADPFVQCAQ